MVVNLASVDTEEQMVNWVGLLKYSKYWKQDACTWDGRVAFWSAARRAKSTIVSSAPNTRGPTPLSITLKPDIVLTWKARMNEFIKNCMVSVFKNDWYFCHSAKHIWHNIHVFTHNINDRQDQNTTWLTKAGWSKVALPSQYLLIAWLRLTNKRKNMR